MKTGRNSTPFYSPSWSCASALFVGREKKQTSGQMIFNRKEEEIGVPPI